MNETPTPSTDSEPSSNSLESLLGTISEPVVPQTGELETPPPIAQPSPPPVVPPAPVVLPVEPLPIIPPAPPVEPLPVVPPTPPTPPTPPAPPVAPVPPPVPPKPKAPMRPVDFLKIVGALFLVALIFFGSFLAYIVFNPGQAKFFIQFGINPSDIATLLERLVNGIFGGITFFVSIVWVIFIFRAIVTKKEYKKKKTVSTILAVFFMIVLFSNISFWAYLVKTIGAEDFVNPNGGVVIYDNDRFLSERFKNSSEIYDFNNLIGPVTLRLDLDSDARYASKLMDIESFSIDFDGDGIVDKEGTDPRGAKDLVFTYEKKWKYTMKGEYVGKDAITRESKTLQMLLPVVNVSALVSITNTKKGIVYDAKDTSLLGNPKWYEGENLDVPASTEAVYTTSIPKEEKFLCLSLVNNSTKEESCDKVFIVKAQGEDVIQAKIVASRIEIDDPLSYRIALEDVKVRSGWEIADYRWTLDEGTVFCKEEECEYTFNDYGKKKISVRLTDAARKYVDIDYEFTIHRPLLLSKGAGGKPLLRVLDSNGNDMIENSYDSVTESYRIEDIVVPSELTFDAQDVLVRNGGYYLDAVEWDFAGKDRKTGKKVEYEILNEGRTEVKVKYIFKQSGTDELGEVEERIVLEAQKKDLAAQMKIVQDSEYAPSTIRFDGSASSTKNGTITKFIYDFGAGKPPAEGDAVQTYRYDAPGEYTVTFTVVKDDGTKDVISRKIVLKDPPKALKINSSVSSGIVGKGIDFDVFGSIGQIESYSWDFGDESPLSAEPTPSHAYETDGTYTVKLQVRYADGTLRNAEKEMTVR